VTAERSFLKILSADCHSPVAALATVEGTMIKLRAEILLPDGSESVSGASEFETRDVKGPARLAQKLLGQASSDLKAIFRQ